MNSNVPMRINMVGPQSMDIPDGLEGITNTFSSFNTLSGINASKESNILKQKLVATQADFVSVFTDFDPESGANGNGSNDACGTAMIPTSNITGNDLRYSMNHNSIVCKQSQFVLIHELVHSFGSVHDVFEDEDVPFTEYARGQNIASADTNNNKAFATLMAGCRGETLGDPDPSDTDCKRKPYLSDPDVVIEGAPIGVENEADNARFLTECDTKGSTPCRREQLASRDQLNATINMNPFIEITNEPASITATNSFVLNADVFDDGIHSVYWKIIDSNAPFTPSGPIVQEGLGDPNNNSFNVTTFTEGWYYVIAEVTDDLNQKHQDEFVLNVFPSNQVPEITLAKTVWQHRYAIELNGNDFPSDATIQVREDVPGGSVIDTYSGNLIFNRSNHPTTGLNRLIFPIVEPSQQALLRDPGLCFRVVSGSNSSNEMCTQRPANVADQGDFLGAPVQSYSTAQDPHFDAYVVKGNGGVLKLHGNNWKKVAYNHDITTNTVLEFNFKSTHQEPRIAGVGFVMSDGSGGSLGNRFWQLYGIDTFGRQELNNFSGFGEVTYQIPVGQHLTGRLSHLVFIADEDIRVGHNTVFLYPEFKLQGADEYDDIVTGARTFDDDVNGRGKLWTNPSVNDDIHNLHDQGDVDWTIIYAEDFKVRTELMGSSINPRISLYKWISATSNPSLGYYTFVNDFLVGTENDSWNNPLINFDTEANSYAVKVESPTGQFGSDTEYKLIFESISNGTADAYENSTLYGDDSESTPVFWQGATDTIHYKNFHDNNDIDYVLVYTPSFNAEAIAIGPDADIKMTVYRWDAADQLPNGAFVNIVKQEVGRDWSAGDSFFSINTNQADTYVIKIESRNGAYGNGTNYSLRLY